MNLNRQIPLRDPDPPALGPAAIVAFSIVLVVCFFAAKVSTYIMQKYANHTQTPVPAVVSQADAH